MTERISSLLQKLLAAKDLDECRAAAAELQFAIREHVEGLRQQIASYKSDPTPSNLDQPEQQRPN